MTTEPENIFAHEPGYKEYREGKISFDEFFALVEANSSGHSLSSEDQEYYRKLDDFYSSEEGQEVVFQAFKKHHQEKTEELERKK